MSADPRPAAPPTATGRDPAEAPPPGWITVVSGRRQHSRVPSLRRLIVQLSVIGVLLVCLVALAGILVSRHIAGSQAVHDVAQRTDLLAESVLQPALTDAMATEPAAARSLDSLVRNRILSDSLVRVKLWSPSGTILYADDAQLIGQDFGLDDSAREALSTPRTQAEVTDLGRPENALERAEGRLLEVYRPVWTPAGHELLFETYFRYDTVTDRSAQLAKGFAGITLSSVALVFLLLLPIVWTLLRRAEQAQRQRQELTQRALDASTEERQRIAAALHDGVVQDLAAASFAVAGAAEAVAADRPELASRLRDAAGTVRAGLGGLRSLVVDIYPASLRDAGLAAALRELAASSQLIVHVRIAPETTDRLDLEQQQAVFRIVAECLRNTAKHADASSVTIELTGDQDQVVTEVIDDGRGFDPDGERTEQSLGLSLMAQVANGGGGRLELRTAPGAGTGWRFTVPLR